MSQTATSAVDPATDPNIDPQIRSFLVEVNKDTFPIWEKPGPEIRASFTTLQAKTAIDMSGVIITSRTISQDGRNVKLYIVKPQKTQGKPPVILFIHGGVWIAGNFENHQRLVRDLVVGTGAAAVFPEYTPIPDAVYPTQIEENYAAAKWVAEHGAEIGVDGSRMVVAGNSVGGNMSTVVAMMAKDRRGPNISFQVLLVPTTDTDFHTESYRKYANGRFLARGFMQFGWNIYAPDAKTRKEAYAAPLQASIDQLRGLPPALIVTAENDPLRDEGEAYARKLKEADVEVTATRYNGMIHDFVTLNAINSVAGVQAAIRQTCDEIKQRL